MINEYKIIIIVYYYRVVEDTLNDKIFYAKIERILNVGN